MHFRYKLNIGIYEYKHSRERHIRNRRTEEPLKKSRRNSTSLNSLMLETESKF